MSSFYHYITAPFTVLNIIIITPILFITFMGINMIKEYNLQKESINLLEKSK